MVAVHRIAHELARRIGPYADFAVARAARTSTDLDALCREVALELPDGPARIGFLEAIRPDNAVTSGPGFCFGAQRDAVVTLVCDQWLRAKDEVLILATPPSCLPAFDLAGGTGSCLTSKEKSG